MKFYSAWLSEADQRAAPALAARMPDRPTEATQPVRKLYPYEAIAADLRTDIEAGRLKPGERIPTLAELQRRYGVANATAHRSIRLLHAWGMIGYGRFRQTPPSSSGPAK